MAKEDITKKMKDIEIKIAQKMSKDIYVEYLVFDEQCNLIQGKNEDCNIIVLRKYNIKNLIDALTDIQKKIDAKSDTKINHK